MRDMKEHLSRRDFLKLISASPGLYLAHKLWLSDASFVHRSDFRENTPNVIILVLDALTAKNISLYGYPRRTMPNLEKFSRRATVYHRHYASYNGTAQSTASFFTGLYPWRHKVYNYYDKIKKEAIIHNFYAYLERDEPYHNFAYTDNIQADLILHQLDGDIDQHLHMGELGINNYMLHDKLTSRDGFNSLRGLDVLMFGDDRTKPSGSLVGSVISRIFREIRDANFSDTDNYPRGIGYSANRRVAFTLEDSFENIRETIGSLESLQRPYLAYYHMYFPHAPYSPNKVFFNSFVDDGFHPTYKKPHALLESVHRDRKLINAMRRFYDEYIANIDHELGQLFDHLERTGILDDSYLIVTSDHGELFERGWIGHGTPLLYESNIHIPLVISKPGQQVRNDVFSLTSTVDIAPTLLEITGHAAADKLNPFEGRVLPDIGEESAGDHVVYSMNIAGSSAFSPIEKASFAVFRGDYKLIEYYGYDQLETPYELYNLRNDPEEMDDLSKSETAVAKEMRAVLKSELDQVQRNTAE